MTACKNFSARWIALPVSPSAEQFSRVFFFLVDAVLKHTNMQNGEGDVTIHSVIVHETDTGYAQCFREDIENVQMGELSLADIVFSEQVKVEWAMSDMYDRLKNGDLFDNPTVDLQVKV